MFRAILIGLVGLIVATSACDKAASGEAPAVVAGATAGTVVDVGGKVTASRDGKTRDLAKGDAISGDDTIATGADGKITIELAHNGARWSLIANKSQKVSEGVAWALPKADGSAAIGSGDTSAGGVHAEKSAADTAATAELALEQAKLEAAKRADAMSKIDEKAAKIENKHVATQVKIDGNERANDKTEAKKAKEEAKRDNDKQDVKFDDDDLEDRKDVKAPDTAKPTDPGKGGKIGNDCVPNDPLCTPAPKIETPAAIFKKTLVADRDLHACTTVKTHVTLACARGTCTVKSASTEDAKIRACVLARVNKLSPPVPPIVLDVDLP